MNVEAYDLDSLRKLVRSLQDENRRLKELLDKADIAYESENVFDEKIESIKEYDSDREDVFKINILQKNWQINILQCFGEEWMFMPKEARREDIFHSVIIDGMTGYVRNSVVKKSIVKPVRIGSGRNLSPRKLSSISLDIEKMVRMY